MTYGIRPQHLRLDPNGLEITVVALEPTGSETHIIGTPGDQPITGIFREQVQSQASCRMRVSRDVAAIRRFDAEDQRVN